MFFYFFFFLLDYLLLNGRFCLCFWISFFDHILVSIIQHSSQYFDCCCCFPSSIVFIHTKFYSLYFQLQPNLLSFFLSIIHRITCKIDLFWLKNEFRTHTHKIRKIGCCTFANWVKLAFIYQIAVYVLCDFGQQPKRLWAKYQKSIELNANW